jgi:hypothetical protein
MAGEPIAYAGGPYAKGAFVMDMLRGHLGEEKFDALMHAYFERFHFRHPRSEDFIALAEEYAGEDLDWFFDPWLRGTGVCDYAVQGISSHRQDDGRRFETCVQVERLGDVRMPVEVTLETKGGETVTRRIDGLEDRTVVCFETPTPGARASLDPEGKILEVDRWNNHFPRRVEFRPLFDFPSFDASYLWLGPSGSLNSYDGLRLGLWLRGGQFPDFEMVKGRNNFTLGASYGFGSRKVWYDFTFGTPLHFRRDRIRLGTGIARGWGQHKAFVKVQGRFAGKIIGPPEHLLLAGIRMRDVYDLEPLCSRNWERAWTLGPVLHYTFRMKTLGFSGRFSAGYRGSFEIRPGDRRFDRLYCDLSSRLRVPPGAFLDLRIFGGWSRGEIPSQDQFFLYGRLEPEGIAQYIADGKGSFCTQEHVHIPGDGNMLGYINQYRRDKVILTMNLGFTVPFLPVGSFMDIGALSGELSSLDEAPVLADFGLKLDLSVLRLYFPLWVSHPRSGEKNWGFRWLVELGPQF